MGRFSNVVLVLMASLLLASTTEKSHASSPAKSHAPSQSSAPSKASPSPSPSSAPPKAAPTTPEADSPPSPPSSSPVSSAEISPSLSSGSSFEFPTSAPNLAVSKKFAWSTGFTLQTWLNKYFGSGERIH
ncbi:mucin-1-like [Prunus yedoensis var. nudiflora]|uniref:Mucin-1-like n=1 Tax=Prunus yedoensis var. nudiflora TaxID=2094558 RepID=A0A314UVJ0_PRUYE|nr:mucin-1-like [Prunus yedoensis var. nudiflora]